LESLAMENLGIFYDHLVYFTAIINVLWPFGLFCGYLVYFSPFWYFVHIKIWQLFSQGDQIGRLFTLGSFLKITEVFRHFCELCTLFDC
jgi:hypothetical protein